MELLRGEAFTGLFRACQRSAFHLELRDGYDTPDEAEPFRRFLTGEPDDFAWHRPWLDLVREVTSAGVAMTRVRVASEPHSDYIRWGFAVAPQNIAAGEEIRWLPRHLTEGIRFPEDDFWLFDDERLIWTVFAEDGEFLGGREVADPRVVERCREVRDEVWARAIPHDRYVSSIGAGRD